MFFRYNVMPLCIDVQIYMCLLLNKQNNYFKLQPLLLIMLKLVLHRFNHWNTFFYIELVGFFFFIILKKTLYFDRL